jgi:aspartate/methionine/tyrosine aminotransferase
MTAGHALVRRDRLRLAARMVDIEPFHVMEIGRRAEELERAGRRIVHMEIGQPDFPAPPQVIEAAVSALRTQPLGYTAALGTPALREAIARFYAERYRVDITPERIIVTSGASGAFLIAMGALVDPGDEWLMPDPCYPCNRHFVRLFEGTPTTIPSGPERHYQLEHADVVRHWSARTRGVMLASPSNPTGTVVPGPALEAIVAEVRRRRGFVLVDEIYQGLTYGGPHHPTALGLGADLFVVNSFSKYFNMTGWRLGWLVAPAEYVREMERLAQNAYICPSAPAQVAALAAFRPETTSGVSAPAGLPRAGTAGTRVRRAAPAGGRLLRLCGLRPPHRRQRAVRDGGARTRGRRDYARAGFRAAPHAGPCAVRVHARHGRSRGGCGAAGAVAAQAVTIGMRRAIRPRYWGAAPARRRLSGAAAR